MPYQPRPLLFLTCAHCGRAYTARHVRSTYCSHSCNVRASHARNGRRRPAPVAAPVAPANAPAGLPALPFFRQLHADVVRALADQAADQAARHAEYARILNRPAPGESPAPPDPRA